MLKNLKRKFIVINMLLVGIVLLVVFVSLNVGAYNNQMREIERTLNEPLNAKIEENGQFGYMTSMIVVTDRRGNIDETFIRGATMTHDKLLYAVDKALEGRQDMGKIGKLKLFYGKGILPDDRLVITFVDSSRLSEIMAKTITTSVITFIIAMIIVFFISRFLSSLAIKPVQNSWEQQKRFIADASHELKTPLTVILANNQILKSKRYSLIEDEEQWIDSTYTEAEHMKKLVEDMLFLAKNDSMDLKVQKAPINLSEMVEYDILHFEPIAYEQGTEIVGDIQPSVEILADATQIKQLIHILLDNSIKYAQGDVKKVDISLKNNELIVKNTGKAISEKQLKHIFERFYRGDEARTKQEGAGGYGLGLAIAKTIVENHSGQISVASGKDKGPDGMEGTAFTIKI